MSQLAIPVEVPLDAVLRKRSFGAAIELCVELSEMEPKQVLDKMRADKAQLSRWQNGQEGVNWPKLRALMDCCGNPAPVLWQVAQCGYDLYSLRKRETATEREVRLLRDENAALRRALARGVA